MRFQTKRQKRIDSVLGELVRQQRAQVAMQREWIEAIRKLADAPRVVIPDAATYWRRFEAATKKQQRLP
jgi:hypothetical protein